MSRKAWRALWYTCGALAVVGMLTSLSRATPRTSAHITLLAALADGLANGVGWLIVLTPVFCLVAWRAQRGARRRQAKTIAPAVPGCGESDANGVLPTGMTPSLTPEQQELTRKVRAVDDAAGPVLVAQPDWVALKRVLVITGSVAAVVLVLVIGGGAMLFMRTARSSHAAPARVAASPDARAEAPPPDRTASASRVQNSAGDLTTDLSIDEKLEVRRLFASALQSPESVSVVKPKLWKILNAHGGLSEEVADEVREQFVLGLQTSRLWMEDALVSLRERKPFKSTERENLENELIAKGAMTDFRRRQNEEMMAKVAVGEPIKAGDGSQVVLTEEVVRSVLQTYARKEQALATLLTPPSPSP